MKTIAFFNSTAGVGTTTLVYHLAWMFADLGHRVLAVDLDPQSNLTRMFLDSERLAELWPDGPHPDTIHGAAEPVLHGSGGINPPHVEALADNLGLFAGDFALSVFEDRLGEAWRRCIDGDESAFGIMTVFHEAMVLAAEQSGSELGLVDVGPNLGAINRAALLASQHMVIPVLLDLYSIEGLRTLGPQLRAWREAWRGSGAKPQSVPAPGGYIVMQHSGRVNQGVQALLRWMERMPGEFRRWVANETSDRTITFEDDPYCLAFLRHYRSLIPLAIEARKPVFRLKPADGAIGAHAEAVRDCYNDFHALASRILSAIGPLD